MPDGPTESETEISETESILAADIRIDDTEPQSYDHYLALLGSDETDFYPEISAVDVDY